MITMKNPENFQGQDPKESRPGATGSLAGQIKPVSRPTPETHSAENLASLYEDLGDIQNDFRNKNLYALLTRELKNGSLLDIGCGAGHFLNLARQKGLPVTGIEPNPALIALSEKFYGRSADILPIGIDQIDRLGALQFDNITMLDVLEHIENDGSLLKTLRPLLKTHGRLVILVPCYRHLYGTRDKKLGHYRRYEKQELVDKLKTAGYKILRCRFWNMLGYFAYGIAEKILHKELSGSLRSAGKKTWAQRFCSRALDRWLGIVENHVNFGFGLSLLCIATPEASANTSKHTDRSKNKP
jgi:SAM-dependent methyltransferase